ncbi:DUF5694 domain-containing protein [Brevundimonas sp.]|uniref:DUF5694 domain-containing protein n=1 Tax=Brevundimonas sp. TaxID=1871086 RepID=UPI002D5EA9A2|nr:DUF5694 domain-containing protein [Brevundimonas sp.]HYC96469.1 DUF5694 domain-containing protein [Brevundimonas sp.]
MLKILAALAVLALPTAALAQAPEPEPIEVMILGTYHFGNPGQDLHNPRIDSVLTPGKQAQLEAVVEGLARFRPTAIAVERVAADPATMLDHRYPAFTPADLLTNPDERCQIGYRLAHRMGLTRVYAIDEQEGDGEPTYFPFEAVHTWAQANGRAGDLTAMHAIIAAKVAHLEQRQRTRDVGSVLAFMNGPAPAAEDKAFHYALMQFGAGDAQPGAVLNGRWFTRNAEIFARLMQVAEPGDRIVVVYGAGHASWLREMVQVTPGFRLVEPDDYLPAE